MSKKRKIISLAVLGVLLLASLALSLLLGKGGAKESLQTIMRDAVLHEDNKIRLFGLMDVNPAVVSGFIVTGVLLVLAALAGGAWSLPGWRCWRPAACLAHGRARLFGSLALVLVLFIGWRLWPAPGRYTPPPVSYPSRRTRPTPPRLAPAPARACPSCRRAPVPPSPDGPPKIATARRRGYLPRPVSSPGKLC